jgi:hypothetical protein
MGSIIQKNDNLVKMLDGLSLLDEHDRERFAKMVDTLDYTHKQVEKNLFNDTLKNDEKREQGSTA